MSCRRTEETFKVIDVKIDALSEQDLLNMEEAIKLAIEDYMAKKENK